MQITVNSPNIIKFGFSVVFNTYNRTITFDTTQLTQYVSMSGHGSLYVQGISFGLSDEDGVELMKIDFTAPQLPTPATNGIYVFDASALNYAFLFQSYKITGAIKDQDGMIYSVDPTIKKVCQPTDFNESGYVSGVFQVIPNCVDNTLTIKELTLLTLCNQSPISKTKTGTLYYPTGTISPVAFTFTPFLNSQVYTGEYRIVNNTLATYDLNDDVYEIISYRTDNNFPVTCANRMSDILCCITDLQRSKEKNCDNAIGKRAAQQLDEVQVSLMLGLLKEVNGQDASEEAAFIKKVLNCNCGSGSILQNEFDSSNPASSIVITGVGGTTVSSTISGDTKNYAVASKIYQVVKNDNLDTAYSISVDTATANTVKYKIAFNYNVMAGYILTAIANNPTLIIQLNSLITSSSGGSVDLTNLDGKCIVDLSSTNYFLSLLVPAQTAAFQGIMINGTLYNSPVKINVQNTTAIQNYINGLGLGTFQVSYSISGTGAYFNITTNGNANTPNSAQVYIGDSSVVTPLFQHTNVSLVAFLQALVDYLCGLTALQVALGNNLTLCTLDYNGDVLTSNYTSTQPQSAFNNGVSAAICNLAGRIASLQSITCAKIAAIFQDRPNAIVYRMYGSDGSDCTSFSDRQIAMSVIASINAYTDVKAAFCAIDCKIPAECPEIGDISINMSGNNIGIYGLSWVNTPNAAQTVTVRYRDQPSTTWIVATNSLVILPNGNISGTSPFLILSPTLGDTYDIQIINNCGGVGFIKQFTTPASGVYTTGLVRGNVLYLLCASNTGFVTLYSSAPFGVGVTMYTDFALTTPFTGYMYLLNPNTGEIYSVNSSTGVVLSDTGINCLNGTPNAYQLANSTGSACAAPVSTLYTNGTFAVGKTLYLDAGLTSPVTGYSYVVYNNIIFTINSGTGVIGASTGLACVNSTTLTIDYAMGTWDTSLSTAVPFAITVSGAEANGSTANTCLTAIETDDITPLVIAAGLTSATQNNGGLTAASTYYKIKNVAVVNGTPTTNGGTVIISGVTITVVILNLNCVPYPS